MNRPGEVHSEGRGGNIDMFAIDVRVAQNHRDGFVAADLHDGRNIGFGAHESGDGGVPHDVRRDDVGVHPGSADGPPETIPEVEAVAGLGVRISPRKDPAFRVGCLAAFMKQGVGEIGRDRLLAAATLGDRHEDAFPVEIDHWPFDADDFRMAHAGAQPDRHEQPKVRIHVGNGRVQQRAVLSGVENRDATLTFAFHLDLGNVVAPDPAPHRNRAHHVVEGCEFAVDGCVCCLLVAPGFSIATHREFRDLVQAHRPEVRRQMPRKLALLAGDVLARAVMQPLHIVLGGFSKEPMGFASRRQVEAALTCVRSGLLDKCLGLCPRDAFAFLADDAVDALAIADHVN